MTVTDLPKAPTNLPHAHHDIDEHDDVHVLYSHDHEPVGEVGNNVKILTLIAVVVPPVVLAVAIWYAWGCQTK